MHACRCASNISLGGFSSGALVFQRDMFLDLPLVTDIVSLQKFRQARIDKALLKANNKRIRHEFKVNDYIYFHNKHNASDKLKPVWTGPCKILQVHTNNTVTIQRDANIEERMSIRRIKPSKAAAPQP